VFQEGNWAFRRPRHSGHLGARIDWQRLSVDVSGVFTGRYVDNDFGLFAPGILEIAAHTVWDARLAVKLGAGVTGLVTIDNLGNKDYMEPLGYQALQRVVRAGLRVSF
jgi:outer membrane receptor protein involved in Fe transport